MIVPGLNLGQLKFQRAGDAHGASCCGIKTPCSYQLAGSISYSQLWAKHAFEFWMKTPVRPSNCDLLSGPLPDCYGKEWTAHKTAMVRRFLKLLEVMKPNFCMA